MILSNLKRILPHKSDKELLPYLNQFYTNMSDIFLESMKANSQSLKDVLKKFELKNPEIINDNKAKHPLLICAGHFGNWEFTPLTLGAYIDRYVIGIVSQLSNRKIGNYVFKQRTKFGVGVVLTKESFKLFEEQKNSTNVFGLIADQSPHKYRKAYWVDFFGKPVGFQPGTELLAIKYNWPVYYGFIRKVGRGKYTLEFEVLTADPSKEEKGAITQKFASNIEKQIKESPSDWLLSHNRWKHAAKVDEAEFVYKKN